MEGHRCITRHTAKQGPIPVCRRATQTLTLSRGPRQLSFLPSFTVVALDGFKKKCQFTEVCYGWLCGYYICMTRCPEQHCPYQVAFNPQRTEWCACKKFRWVHIWKPEQVSRREVSWRWLNRKPHQAQEILCAENSWRTALRGSAMYLCPVLIVHGVFLWTSFLYVLHVRHIYQCYQS